MSTVDEILKKAGLDLPVRQKFVNSLVTAVAAKDEAPDQPRASEIAGSLKTAGFSDDAINKITKALASAGHVADDLGAMNANAANLTPIQRQALKVAARNGIPMNGGSVDSQTISRVCAAKSPEERIAIKSLIYRAGMLSD